MFTTSPWLRPQVAIALLAFTPVTAQSPKLSLAKVEQLIASKVPDGVVAREIQNRGLDPAPTKATLEALRRKGAGPATLAAVRSLVWFGGHLDLQVIPADARVEIIGPDGRRYQPTPDLALSVGSYVIKAARQNFQAETRTQVIEDGQRATLVIRLTPDQSFLRGREQQIQGNIRYKDAMITINAAKELLALDPGNVAARGFLASGHWKGFHGKEFQSTALEALKAGAKVSMPLFHEEQVRGRTTTSRHEVEVAVMPAGFMFDPGVMASLSCSLRRMEIPYASLSEVRVSQTAEGEPFILVKAALREQPGEFIAMKLFRTKDTPNKPGVRSNQFNRLAADAPPESAPIEMFEILRNVIRERGGARVEDPPPSSSVPSKLGTANGSAPAGKAVSQGNLVAVKGIYFEGVGSADVAAKIKAILKKGAEASNRFQILEEIGSAGESAKGDEQAFMSGPSWIVASQWGKEAGVDYVVYGTGKLENTYNSEWYSKGHHASILAKVYLVEVRTGKVLKLLRLSEKAKGDTYAAAYEALVQTLTKECQPLYE